MPKSWPCEIPVPLELADVKVDAGAPSGISSSSMCYRTTELNLTESLYKGK